MRVLFDANIYISYLLPSRQAGTIEAIVEAAVEGAFTLLIPAELVREFSRRVATKEYLARRILPEEAAQFMAILEQEAEVVPEIPEPIPTISRDAKDNYLLAHALLARADYLVTGDEDLLVLRKVGEVEIVSPAGFLRVLRESGSGR